MADDVTASGEAETETEDLEALERERIELLKRLEAEEDGEIRDGDDDDEELELPERDAERQPMNVVPKLQPEATGAGPRNQEAVDAEPVSDGELDDSPESPAIALTEAKLKAPPAEINIPTSPVKDKFDFGRGGDYDWNEEYEEPKLPPPTTAKGRPTAPAPQTHQKYNRRPQIRTGQFGGSSGGSITYKGFDNDENWGEPPPASRPRLTSMPTPMPTKSHLPNRNYESRQAAIPQRQPPQMQIGGSSACKGFEDDENWDDPEPQMQSAKVQAHDEEDYDWSCSGRPPIPPLIKQRPGPLLTNPTAMPRFNPNLHQHQNAPPAAATAPEPALTGRALWAQRAKELETLNPIGDWLPGKKKGKGKKGNQPPGPGLPLPGPEQQQHQPFMPMPVQTQAQCPRAPGPQNNPYHWKKPGPGPAVQTNWASATASTPLISDENEDWDQPSLHLPRTQNWEPDQPNRRSSLPMCVEGDDHWDEPPLPPGPGGAIANRAGGPPTPSAPASAPPTPATPLQISVSVPEPASAAVSYSVYANTISSLLQWYGYSSSETHLLLSAPNLFRVRYEQLTVHLSANESALEQCFKVIGNDHDAYFKEGFEQKGLSDWRRVVSGDVWGTPTPTPRTGALPPPPPSQFGNSLKAILKPSQSQQQQAADKARLYFPRPSAEPQAVQLELIALETRTAQDQFNPANATLPYQVFLEYGSFGDGISHEITRFRYVEYVAQVNSNSKDLLPSVVSAYGLGVGGWPTKVKEWLEMRFGAFKRVAQQPLHQQNGPPPLVVPLIPMPPTPTALMQMPTAIPPSMASMGTPMPFQQQFYPQPQPPLPPSTHTHAPRLSPPPMPSPHQHQHRPGRHPPPPPQPPLPPSGPPSSPDPALTPIQLHINYDHFQRLYARSNPALHSASVLHSVYSEFCVLASARYSEYVHGLCSNWFPGVPAQEVHQLLRGLDSSGVGAEGGGGGQIFRNTTPAPTQPSLAPLLNGGAGAAGPRIKSRGNGNTGNGNGDAASSMSSSSEGSRRRTSTEKPILVTSKAAFRAAFKRRAEIKREST